MQALILAAGMGKRMGKYTQNCTKCMVSVGEKTLIERMIEALKKAGIKRTVLVVGYKDKELIEFLTKKIEGMELVYIHNDDYENTNNIYSLYLARRALAEDDTVLLESDLIFDEKIIELLVKSPDANMVTVAKYEQWMDGTVALLDEKMNIVDFVEKADFRFAEVENYYKTVNIYKFSKEFLQNQYIPFLEAYIKAYGKNQYYELVLKILAHIRYSELKAFVLEDYNWYEIDNEQDLQIADAIFAVDEKQFSAYDHQFGGFWRFPKLKDFCYLVNPYYPPQKMLDQMKYFYDTLLRGYPSGLKTQNLNAGRMLNVDADYLITGNGAAELIYAVGRILKGRLLVQVPVFNEYVRCFPQCSFEKIYSDSYEFCIPTEVYKRKVKDADIVVLVNPDNPSGSFIKYSDIIEILQVCKEQGKKCIIDESFVDFAEEGIRYTLIDNEILEEFSNLIVIKSISKSYGVPGLRLGVLASSDKAFLNELKGNMPIWNINSFAEYFLQIHSLYEADYKKACNEIALQRKVMIERLRENPLLEVFPSEANYIMCRLKGNMKAKELANVLVKKYNILIKDLSEKDGIKGSNYIRVAVKAQEENDLLITAVNEIIY